MAKYRVTEAQLQKIFEDLEMKRLSEYDNYGFFNINEDLWTQDSILNAFRTEIHRRVNGTV